MAPAAKLVLPARLRQLAGPAALSGRPAAMERARAALPAPAAQSWDLPREALLPLAAAQTDLAHRHRLQAAVLMSSAIRLRRWERVSQAELAAAPVAEAVQLVPEPLAAAPAGEPQVVAVMVEKTDSLARLAVLEN